MAGLESTPEDGSVQLDGDQSDHEVRARAPRERADLELPLEGELKTKRANLAAPQPMLRHKRPLEGHTSGEMEPPQRTLKAHRSEATYPPCSPMPLDDFDTIFPPTGVTGRYVPPPSPCTALYRPTVEQGIKFVIVSGGVCSSLGKGVTTSSIGALLRGHGFRVTAIKLDPYLNIDAGLMSPYEHGEVFVLDDGGETDLDLGNYERMMYLSLNRDNNITTGKIYDSVIKKERKGEYLGKTVTVVPHITGAIVEWINRVAAVPVDGTGMRPQICMIELGGTVGDMESMPFIEALRMLKFNAPDHSVAWCHCSYVPNMSGQKTKPTQHSVKALLSLGVQPDLIVCRSADPLLMETKKKISNQCNIHLNRILSAHDVKNLFHVPQVLAEQHVVGLLNGIIKLNELEVKPTRGHQPQPGIFRSLKEWNAFANQVDEAEASEEVRIAFVGKYNQGGGDAYQSAIAALHHSAVAKKRKLVVQWVDASDLEEPLEACKRKLAEDKLANAHGIFVPGGFGDRGVEGMIYAASYARTHKKPYFGVCLGMQVALIEFARNVLSLQGATSEEFDKDGTVKPHILIYMPEISKETMGANMRLGARVIEFADPKSSIAAGLYGGVSKIFERHRHRYEFNIKYRHQMEERGLVFAGQDESRERMDVIELSPQVHPFFLGVQYHPEYKSRPGCPSPPFFGFVSAACDIEQLPKDIQECRARGSQPHWTPLDTFEL